jgi:hypothetical protein
MAPSVVPKSAFFFAQEILGTTEIQGWLYSDLEQIDSILHVPIRASLLRCLTANDQASAS